MKSESDFVKKILDGDLNAFRNLVEQYQNLVMHVVFRLVTRHEDREEICQEVFIKVYQNLSGFKFQSKLSTWIGKIAYTTTINYLRKFKLSQKNDRIKESINPEADNEFYNPVETIHSDIPSPLETMVNQDMAGLIHKIIEQLPPPYQTIITLYHLDQMSYQEIAGALGISQGTVMSRLFRAKKDLEKILKAMGVSA